MAFMGADPIPNSGTIPIDAVYDLHKREYLSRLQTYKQGLERVMGRIGGCGSASLLPLLGAVALGIASLLLNFIPAIWLVLPIVMGVYIFRALAENDSAYCRTVQVVRFYEWGVSRIRNQWQGNGESGSAFLLDEHLYAGDLDLFGTGSMFELLCTARTGAAKTTLAKWLLSAANAEQIVERQQAIAELRDQLDLREQWASVGKKPAVHHISGSVLRDWSDAERVLFLELRAEAHDSAANLPR